MSRATIAGGVRPRAVLLIVAILFVTASPNAARVPAADAPIRLNTVGFLPGHDKRAAVSTPRAAATTFCGRTRRITRRT